jgi:hydroxyacylglutathione hydrolase
LIEGIQTKLLVLPDKTQVHCGHGPSTTIGQEKHQNPYLR